MFLFLLCNHSIIQCLLFLFLSCFVEQSFATGCSNVLFYRVTTTGSVSKSQILESNFLDKYHSASFPLWVGLPVFSGCKFVNVRFNLSKSSGGDFQQNL